MEMTGTRKGLITMSSGTDPLAVRHLTDLQTALIDAGLHATVVSRDGNTPPHLNVNAEPRIRDLAEDVHCAPAEGVWWFWWSWAERIAPVSDLDTTVQRVTRVVTPARA